MVNVEAPWKKVPKGREIRFEEVDQGVIDAAELSKMRFIGR